MMSKIKILVLAVFSVFAGNALSQNLELTSSAGGYDEGSNGSVSWSIGEPIIQTYEGTSVDVTQGFHQSDIYVVSVENLAELEINIYPNPTRDFINIESEQALKVNIFDASGRLVDVVEILEPIEQIDVSSLSRGAYSFVFESEGMVVKTVKIIKQ